MSNPRPIIYKERILWLIFYPLASLSFIFFANDNPFLQLIRLPSFITDIFFSLLVTFSAGIYIRWVTLYLDKKYPWLEYFKKRAWLQCLNGILLPLFVAMTLEVVYLKLIDIPLASSSILYLELPLAFLLLSLSNSYYVASYLFRHQKVEIITIEKAVPANEKELVYLVVQKGFNELKIDIADCAFIKSSEKLLWLYTFNHDIYRLDGTLDEWEKKFPGIFFRINRQFLASARAIEAVTTTETRKLKVDFVIPLEESIYVSKANSANFRKWWKQ
ncbi:LytTr DNA-binding domain-containing protein [Flexibacter flexilis DSM 6793]|uniref:LytTr DNA-binding domain-containing protein n=1 Tax=Flexibacter flexilis DSM 6793 TaxID=927664 RepID=A0A1I1G000_9BACT|nr:LytTR family DNA-binding domain-containing protein [Flexibacter flexilis]SFC03148.1 LytTr DNA-binding domain-containing protein [Flexibacter flexilis DSM 6793]